MAGFSTKERLIASLLSATPGLKTLVKDIYIRINAAIYKKNYSSKILSDSVSEIKTVEPQDSNGETFFGYYDKTPMDSGGWVLYNETCGQNTLSLPKADVPISINARNLRTGETVEIGKSNSYTWQQGCRAQWLDDDKVIYNCFRNNRYIAAVFSLSQKKEIRTFEKPVQDSFGTDYFLSINYGRIMKLRPDYGYRNLPLPDEREMKNLTDDGIWKVDYESGNIRLVHSLEEIASMGYDSAFDSAQHKVNHVMISPDGKGFIFIHRYYKGKRRFDRLFYSDFKSLRLISDNQMVSHCCWADSNTILGYLRHDDKDGFYTIDIDSGTFCGIKPMTDYNHGDGHPSCFGKWTIFDSYPDKSRMQRLSLYNRETKEITLLAEVFQSVSFKGETRCDLHPRFSMDGKYAMFDSVFKGKRRLCYINISNIIL